MSVEHRGVGYLIRGTSDPPRLDSALSFGHFSAEAVCYEDVVSAGTHRGEVLFVLLLAGLTSHQLLGHRRNGTCWLPLVLSSECRTGILLALCSIRARDI